jgi:hypothetical protein
LEAENVVTSGETEAVEGGNELEEVERKIKKRGSKRKRRMS